MAKVAYLTWYGCLIEGPVAIWAATKAEPVSQNYKLSFPHKKILYLLGSLKQILWWLLNGQERMGSVDISNKQIWKLN